LSRVRSIKRQASRDVPKYEPITAAHPAMNVGLLRRILPPGIPIDPHVLLRVAELLRSHPLSTIGMTLAEELQVYVDKAVLDAQKHEAVQSIIRGVLAEQPAP